jgi:membrane associated rhomboid family serine protease
LRSITDRLTPTVKIFFTTIVLVYLFYVIVRQSRPFIEAHLVLGSQLFKGELWQLVTSLFFHVDFIGFLFGILGLWFIGPFIEGMHGRRRFLILFFGGGILGNLAMAIVYFLLLMKSPAMRAIVEKVGPVPFTDGCWLATTALFVAIGRLFGRQALQLWPLPLSFQARYLVGILIGFELAMALSRGDWPAVAGIIVAVGVGFFGAAPGGMTVIRSWYADARDRAKVRSLRRRFGVIDGGDRPPKKFVN